MVVKTIKRFSGYIIWQKFERFSRVVKLLLTSRIMRSIVAFIFFVAACSTEVTFWVNWNDVGCITHIFISQTLALNETSVFRISELNSMFDVIHQNFDFRVNNAIRQQSENLKILNAQLLSRFGFVVDEIREVERRVSEAIVSRGLNISAPEAECIVDSALSLENALDYAGYSLNGVLGEAIWSVNEIEQTYFYPLMNILLFESNTYQWSVFAEMHRFNPVTNVESLVHRLEQDYEVALFLYQFSIEQIASEFVQIQRKMNEVKEFMFPQMNGVRDYFTFTANFIEGDLSLCEA